MSVEVQKPKTSISDFVRETRNEIAKVSWPTRAETIRTTIVIVVMALGAGMFFFCVDWAMGNIIGRVLGINL